MSDNSLMVRPNMITSLSDAERAAAAMAKSGYFQDATQAAQALVKILAGQEMGFGPFASMNGIHIIKGKPGVGANLQAAAVKGSRRYDYKVRELTDKVCKIEYFEGKESIGVSEFTYEDAVKAGTQNLGKFTRNMLFARAMSNGVKWFCPDVFNGSTVYTPEELGAIVDGEGNVIDQPQIITKVSPPVRPEQIKRENEIIDALYSDQNAHAAPGSAHDLHNTAAMIENVLNADLAPTVATDAPSAYDLACDATDKNGKRYGDKSTSDLHATIFGIDKVLRVGTVEGKPITEEQRAQYNAKRQAAQTIIDQREEVSKTQEEG
jgi:hypothetical protein